MNRLTMALLTLLFVFSAGVPAYAQGVEWETLNAEVLSLYRQGRYEDAITVAKKALKVAEQAGGLHHPAVALSMNNSLSCTRAWANSCRPNNSTCSR